MILYAPLYYPRFSCIAEKCRHSCCVGWEIDVDKRTLEKYEMLGDKDILTSIDREETPHFCLGKNERCPHLDERGLCRIITVHGDGYLCDICREHPRFYHDTAEGREVGVGMACEEACRLILLETDFSTVIEVGKRKGRSRKVPFDALPDRRRVYALLQNEDIPYFQRLAMIAEKYEIPIFTEWDEPYKTRLSSLEYMNEENRVRYSTAFCTDLQTPKEIEGYLLRAFAYFVYRHVTKATSKEDVRMTLGFALFCERLLCSLAVKENALTLENFSEVARTLSEEIEYSEENTETIKILFF